LIPVSKYEVYQTQYKKIILTEHNIKCYQDVSTNGSSSITTYYIKPNDIQNITMEKSNNSLTNTFILDICKKHTKQQIKTKQKTHLQYKI